jgi:hypothetical protein
VQRDVRLVADNSAMVAQLNVEDVASLNLDNAPIVSGGATAA